ncbi:MAG: hypothetical protein AAF608_14485 [Pseudomonadota bacterium]
MNETRRMIAGLVAGSAISLSLFAQGLSQEPESLSVTPRWAFVNEYVVSQTGQRLDEVVQACVDPGARYAPVLEERTFLDAYEDRNVFGSTIVIIRMASWTNNNTVIVRFIVNAAEAAIKGEDGFLSIVGQPGALEGYNWMFTDSEEPVFAGPSPDTMPFQVPCTNAEEAAALLSDQLPLLPSGQGPMDIVEASYQGYLRSINTHFADDRLDPIVEACRAPANAARPSVELISAGYDGDSGSENSGRVYFTLVSHDDQSKELATYFLDPSVAYARSPNEQSLILAGGEAGASGHTGWISPGGVYTHVGSFEVTDGYGDTGAFYCSDPGLASSAVYGLRAWLPAGLPRAPVITYSLRFNETADEEITGCLFSTDQAARAAEQALYAEGLYPQRTDASDPQAQLQFLLTPRYPDMMLPDRCHYTVDAAASWDLNDPGALVVNLSVDPIDTSFRDLDMIASRAGRDFLEREKAQLGAPEPASLP